jgi:hypothetical protein
VTVDWWAGNGGKMVGKKQNKQEEVSDTGEQATEKMDPCCKCNLECATCEEDGAKALRRVACQILKRDCNEISTELAAKAKTGDANCTKLLLLLAGSQKEKAGAKKIKRGRSAALELAAEPEWSEEVVEIFTAPGTDSREPED